MAWYEQWFDRDEYDLVYRTRDPGDAARQVDLVERLGTPDPGARVLDVGCGRGRHAVAFARRGYRVTGLDLSATALRRARLAATEAGVKVRFVRGDMREPVRPGGFDVVVNLFTAFGFFERSEDHERAVCAMSDNLRPGGVLVQDFLNANWITDHLPAEDERVVDGIRIRQMRRIEEGRIKKEIVIDRDGETHTFFESVALLPLETFETMYENAGLRIRHRAGNYDASPYGADSPRLILVAVREA